jgi:hypothetical protein
LLNFGNFEKSDWRDDIIIKRTLEAMEAQQYFANFFVNEARKNLNKLDENLGGLIINDGGHFKTGYGMQIHFFQNHNFTKVLYKNYEFYFVINDFFKR